MLENGSHFLDDKSPAWGSEHSGSLDLPVPRGGNARAQLSEALDESRFSPSALIAALKQIPAVAAAYSGPAFAGECHYDLETHSRRVIEQGVKHFRAEPSGYEGGLFFLALALHDIGKPTAIQTGSTQHEETVRLIIEIANELPVDRPDLARLLALIDGDPLGNYLRGFTNLEEAAREVLELSARASLSPDTFLVALERYYQCDVSAYTRDAGGDPRLDHLFEWQSDELRLDEATGRLPFIGSYLERWDRLRLAISILMPGDDSLSRSASGDRPHSADPDQTANPNG